jgi:AraC family transcriptional regulator
MALAPEPIRHRVLLRSDELLVGDFRCHAPVAGTGAEELAEFHEIVFLRRGLFVRHFGRHRLVADANHVLFFGGDRPYRVSHPVAGGDEGLLLRLAAGDLADVVAEHDPGVRDRPHAPLASGQALSTPRAALLSRRLHVLAGEEPHNALGLEEIAFDLAAEAVRSAYTDRPAVAQARRSATRDAHRETVAAVKILLARRLAERPTLHALAREVGVAPFHLARLFRAAVGLPIHRYLDRLRLRRALDRLAAGEQDLTQLALELGYADHSHFTNAFRREFGLPPSRVRREVGPRRLRELRGRLPADGSAAS